MDLVFMLLGCVAGVWVTQKIWDTEQKGIAVIFGFIGVPLCAVIALYIGMSVGLVKSSGGVPTVVTVRDLTASNVTEAMRLCTN